MAVPTDSFDGSDRGEGVSTDGGQPAYSSGKYRKVPAEPGGSMPEKSYEELQRKARLAGIDPLQPKGILRSLLCDDADEKED